MAENSPKATIIEFNGLPGTGKSTIKSCLSELIKNDNRIVYDNYEKKSFLRYPYSSLLKQDSYKLLPFIFRLGDSCGLNKSKVGQILRLLSYVNNYKQFVEDNPHNTFLIQDEGVIQSLISIAYLESIKGKESELRGFFLLLKKLGITWLQINCRNDSYLSMERITQRGSNLGRFDKMDKAELINALNVQVESFEIIRNLSEECGVSRASIYIDTSLQPEENAKLIYRMINNSKNSLF